MAIPNARLEVCMAQKTATLYARIEPDVKERAEAILAELGMSASSAINMFYKQVILQRGLPFEVKMPSRRPIDISRLDAEELNGVLSTGYADVEEGRTRPASEAFDALYRELGI
jgi:addiction module RelB/DinJ family antitoxin